MQTLYLQTQAIAREPEEVFALQLDPSTLSVALEQGIAEGDIIAVVDGEQDYFTCQVVEAGASGMRVRIAGGDASDSSRPQVHLAFGLCDDASMDSMVAQASELGVAGFLPFSTSLSPSVSSERSDLLQEHWQRLAATRARQAGYNEAPAVGFPESLESACETFADFDAVIVCWEEEDERSIGDAVDTLALNGGDARDVVLVIGPRAGLSEDEMALLASYNHRFATVSLGSAILRTETAVLVAATLLLDALGGFRLG